MADVNNDRLIGWPAGMASVGITVLRLALACLGYPGSLPFDPNLTSPDLALFWTPEYTDMCKSGASPPGSRFAHAQLRGAVNREIPERPTCSKQFCSSSTSAINGRRMRPRRQPKVVVRCHSKSAHKAAGGMDSPRFTKPALPLRRRQALGFAGHWSHVTA